MQGVLKFKCKTPVPNVKYVVSQIIRNFGWKSAWNCSKTADLLKPSFISKRYGDQGKPNYSHMPQKMSRGEKKRVFMSICGSRFRTCKTTAIIYIPTQFNLL